MSNTSILLTSNELWSPFWFSKHHYAHELAKSGHRVYFLNPVKEYRIKNLFSFKVSLEKVPEGLYIVNYKNNFPVRVFKRFFIYLNDLLNTWKLKNHLKIKSKKIIWWQFDFQRFIYLPFFKDSKKIYHVVDPNMNNVMDKKMAEKADLIVCVSNQYITYYEKNFPGKKVIFIPHCVSLNEEKELNKTKTKELKQEYGEYIFFSGSINNDVDYQLIKEILEKGYKVVAAGQKMAKNPNDIQKWDDLLNHPSLKFLGVVPANELKNYIAASVVCIVPYKFELKKVIGSRTPLKVLKYITQNKPVITSINSGIPDLDNKVIYKANNTEEFISLIKKAFQSNLEADKNAIDKYLKKHTYSLQIEKILNEL